MGSKRTNKERNIGHEQLWQLATAVRDACFSVAVTAYENASSDGLCHDGAWECASEAMCTVDVRSIVAKASSEI